jgi:hypothetical protein
MKRQDGVSIFFGVTLKHTKKPGSDIQVMLAGNGGAATR